MRTCLHTLAALRACCLKRRTWCWRVGPFLLGSDRRGRRRPVTPATHQTRFWIGSWRTKMARRIVLIETWVESCVLRHWQAVIHFDTSAEVCILRRKRISLSADVRTQFTQPSDLTLDVLDVRLLALTMSSTTSQSECWLGWILVQSGRPLSLPVPFDQWRGCRRCFGFRSAAVPLQRLGHGRLS